MARNTALFDINENRPQPLHIDAGIRDQLYIILQVEPANIEQNLCFKVAGELWTSLCS